MHVERLCRCGLVIHYRRICMRFPFPPLVVDTTFRGDGLRIDGQTATRQSVENTFMDGQYLCRSICDASAGTKGFYPYLPPRRRICRPTALPHCRNVDEENTDTPT